ncbi:hypothetical protein KSP35_00735 [Aquihabitans sp. G128]|uniref:hypothetical protein n=1 Tax=Aquihabitans sp. G128 TaxID=2849779 RepID=UPI001C23241B|nr:hypothetical protein [Aquihabitans sp. G128]QXC61413.1 hypothetical protein KSP35_00735 [Aquihabitans sp. G128]
MSQGTVGASTSSLSEVTNVATNTATLTGETRTLASQQGQKVQTEITEAAEAFSKEFDNIGTEMQNQITATNNNVQALAATGMSPSEAKAAAADFTQQLGHVQTNAQKAIAEFKTSTTTRAQAINDAIGQKLGVILTNFETDVTSFGTAVTSFSHGLQEADSTSIKYS